MNEPTNTPPTAYNIPTTDLPCPAWCAFPPGHGFDSLTADASTFIRSHERDLGSVKASSGHGAFVTLEATETARLGTSGSQLQLAGVSVDASVDGFTASQARELAALLLQAADRLEQIVAS